MTGLSAAAVASIVVVLLILGSDVWVYTDAKERVRRGDPLEFSLGALVVDTPEAWFLGCLVLWVIFFPLYLTMTERNPFGRP
jgi:cytochrome c oxidase assembly factor CtaG